MVRHGKLSLLKPVNSPVFTQALSSSDFLKLISLIFWVALFFQPSTSMAAGRGGVTYNDARISGALEAVMTYLEGSFGSLIMAAAGIATLVAAAMGQYRAAIGLLVVAIGSFTLRSFMSTFFNDQSLDQDRGRVVVESYSPVRILTDGSSFEIFAPSGTRARALFTGPCFVLKEPDDIKPQVVANVRTNQPNTKRDDALYGDLTDETRLPSTACSKGQPLGLLREVSKENGRVSHLHFEIQHYGERQPLADFFPGLHVDQGGKVVDPEIVTRHLLILPSEQETRRSDVNRPELVSF